MMDAEREKRLADFLLEAFDLPTGEPQREYLRRACGEDQEMFEEALECLALEDDLEEFLETPPEAPTDLHGLEDDDQESEPSREETRLARPNRSPSALVDLEEKEEKTERRRLGAYRLLKKIGEGGMGQVYLGEDERLGRRIAIKILPPQADSPQAAEMLERFEREARALAALNHSGIVTIYSIEQHADFRFLTMELVDGETLDDRIQSKKKLTIEEWLTLAEELSDALGAAHASGVIHRDLKPANIMLTSEGRAKILDFGIAKLSSGAKTTEEGMVLGTIAYMSPEQLKGEKLDARSDLFALGVTLYLAATGRHPFEAKQTHELVGKIVREAPPVATSYRRDLPPTMVELVHRCLEKEPHQRPVDAKEIARRIRALRDERREAEILRARSKPWKIAAVAAAILIAFLSIGLLLRPGDPTTISPDAATSAETAAETAATDLAVLPFQNLSGDPELEWWSDGIAELLATDLAQSPELRLLPRGAQESTDGPQAEIFVRGSFAKIGDVVRLTGVLENPQGKVLHTARFDEADEQGFFQLVDQLNASFLQHLGASRPDLAPKKIADSTTASIEAWQAYTEAQKLYRQDGEAEAAIQSLERALAHDPNFALAALDLSKMHRAQGRGSEAVEFSEVALKNVDSLPLEKRFSVESTYYGGRWATLGRAIDSYSLALKTYPPTPVRQNNLARRYAYFERYHEALEEFQRATDLGREAGLAYWGNYYGAASVQAALGDFASGDALYREALKEQPDHWLLSYSYAWHLTDEGRLDEARDVFADLAERRPDTFRIPYGLWRLEMLAEDWDAADTQARRLLAYDDSFAQWRGSVALARTAILRNQPPQALKYFRAAIDVSQGGDRALASCFLAEFQLQLGDPQGALDAAQKAREIGRDEWPELFGVFLAASAFQELDRPEEADARLDFLRERWRRQPNTVEERQILRLEARLAIARGDQDAGLDALRRAAALLPPRGVEFSWHVFPDHVPLWVELGEAEAAAGRTTAAREWWEKARHVGAERLEHPLPWRRAAELLNGSPRD